MTDIQVLEYAYKQKLTIVSLDADFCSLKKKENYGIIKISGKLKNKIDILLELLSILKNEDLKNIYFQIDCDKAYREEKVYSRKGKFKHYRKIPLILKGLK